MIIDYDQQGGMLESLVVFPDWCFPNLPKQPRQIIETIVIAGGNTTSISITGTADQNEGDSNGRVS